MINKIIISKAGEYDIYDPQKHGEDALVKGPCLSYMLEGARQTPNEMHGRVTLIELKSIYRGGGDLSIYAVGCEHPVAKYIFNEMPKMVRVLHLNPDKEETPEGNTITQIVNALTGDSFFKMDDSGLSINTTKAKTISIIQFPSGHVHVPQRIATVVLDLNGKIESLDFTDKEDEVLKFFIEQQPKTVNLKTIYS